MQDKPLTMRQVVYRVNRRLAKGEDYMSALETIAQQILDAHGRPITMRALYLRIRARGGHLAKRLIVPERKKEALE